MILVLTNSPGNSQRRCQHGVGLGQQDLHDEEHRQVFKSVLVSPLGAVEPD